MCVLCELLSNFILRPRKDFSQGFKIYEKIHYCPKSPVQDSVFDKGLVEPQSYKNGSAAIYKLIGTDGFFLNENLYTFLGDRGMQFLWNHYGKNFTMRRITLWNLYRTEPVQISLDCLMKYSYNWSWLTF